MKTTFAFLTFVLCLATACTDFYELERNILHSTNNRFKLLKAFYPTREAHPVVVKVTYSFNAEQEQTGELGNATGTGCGVLVPRLVLVRVGVLPDTTFGSVPVHLSTLL